MPQRLSVGRSPRMKPSDHMPLWPVERSPPKASQPKDYFPCWLPRVERNVQEAVRASTIHTVDDAKYTGQIVRSTCSPPTPFKLRTSAYKNPRDRRLKDETLLPSRLLTAAQSQRTNLHMRTQNAGRRLSETQPGLPCRWIHNPQATSRSACSIHSFEDIKPYVNRTPSLQKSKGRNPSPPTETFNLLIPLWEKNNNAETARKAMMMIRYISHDLRVL